jgi:hypothetical protein
MVPIGGTLDIGHPTEGYAAEALLPGDEAPVVVCRRHGKSRLTTKLSGPGHGRLSGNKGESEARGLGPLERLVRGSQAPERIV